MDMNVRTSAVEEGARSLKRHCRNIEEVMRALLHNLQAAHAEFDTVNYDRTLQAVTHMQGSVRVFSQRVSHIGEYARRLCYYVDEYNGCGYRE